ncbi:MAG: hypothetical protein C0596_05360 [Marinilabiliales bacterium]|nr:MAG: hypothetical protein C0596_05360 [Marinilabiliales bacterium]
MITDTYTGCYPGSQWKAVWSPTESGYGVTEGGASGAPFLNQEHLIVGTLTGGASYCGASQNMSYDYFGKFDYHWASNGQSNIERLKPWLDPGNVGSYICQGYYPTSTFGMVQGQIYNDINQNCSIDDFEHGIGSYIVEIMPGNITISTNSYGIYSIDSLPEGTYYVTVDTTNQNLNPTCPVTQELIISNSQSVTYAPSFGFYSDQACSDPSISVYAPILRRCFDYQELYVVAHNQYAATSYLEEAYVILELDELISINSSNIPFVELGNSEYRFDIGNVGPGQTISIALLVEVSCDAVLSQTLCMSAKLLPIDECALDNSTNIPGGATGDIPECTLPWDHSSLNVDGWCENDSIYFLITNTGDFGDGDMQCVSPVRIFIDGVLTQVESIQLDGQETYMYAFEATGQTWRLEVDQHPLHPGNSYPNAVVELCGDIVNWVPGYIDSQYQDDADPVVDIFCGQIVGSYDPNDKSQSPTGVGELGFIGPNQMLEYRIRFQNTGNDTAFTVVVKDTLDSNLNLFTVVPGVASHDYEFSIENGRVLVWTFNDILLVDSITNEPESHGFLTFKVEQNPDLPYGTVINNDADIYFDFNDPVITNELVYTIYDFNPLLLSQSIFFANEEVSVFPNPADEVLNICFTKTDSDVKGLFKIVDLTGKEIYIEGFSTKSSDYTINIEGLDSGIYILITFMENTMYANRFVVK